MVALLDIVFWGAYALAMYIGSVIILTFFENKRLLEPSPKLHSHPKVTVCIPAYNEEETIAKTIRSVLTLDYPRNKLEIVVVDDGSRDKTYAIAKQFESEGVKVLHQKNRGKGGALNHALAKATGKYFACLDADSIVMAHTLKRMVVHFEKKNVGAVTPLMKVWKPKTLLQKGQWFEYMTYAFSKMVMSTIDCIHVTPGPFSMYDASLLRKYGGFDEESIVEDQEIAFRLQKYHHRIIQTTDGDVYTNAPATLKELYKQRSRWYRGSLMNLIKYKGMLFNREYGDFGMFHMPSLVVGSAFISMVIMTFFVSLTIVPVYHWLHSLWIINFDIWPYLANGFSIKEVLLVKSFGINFSKLFIVVALLAINLKLFVWAYSRTQEEFRVRQLPIILFFFLVYYLVLSGMWVVSIAEVLIGRKKWYHAKHAGK